MAVPVKIDSNITGLSIAEESSLKTLPGSPIWYGLEPNSYSDSGATFDSVARETINNTRQLQKGTITGESAKFGVNIDLTQRNLTRLLQGLFFADAIEPPATQPFNGAGAVFTSVSATQFLASALGLGSFLVNALVYAKGFGATANNGLAHLTAVATGALTTDKALTVEAGPPASASLETVGIRGAAGDIHLSISGSRVILTSTALDFTTLGLVPGEWVFVGGDLAINRFVTSATNPVNVGYARVATIAAHSLQFDLTMFTPMTDADGGGLQKIDIFYGKVIRNAIDPASVKRRTYQIERTLGNDGDGTQSEYMTGAVADQMTINLPEESKVNADLSYVGMDVEVRTGLTGIKSGSRIGLPGEAPFNTSQDVYLSRLAVVDTTILNPAALYAYADDVKLVINNNAESNKAIGVLGGFDVSVGDFHVSGTLTAYFQTIADINYIKNNADVGLQLIFARAFSGMIFDAPLLTLGGGSKKVEKDKPITVDLTFEAAKCPAGYTAMVCVFEYLPLVAMP